VSITLLSIYTTAYSKDDSRDEELFDRVSFYTPQCDTYVCCYTCYRFDTVDALERWVFDNEEERYVSTTVSTRAGDTNWADNSEPQDFIQCVEIPTVCMRLRHL